MLHAADYYFGPSYEVIVFCFFDDPITKSILNEVYNSKNLNKVIILIDPHQKKEVIDLMPFTQFYFNSSNNSPMAYICKNYTCDLPTDNLEDIREKLEVLSD